GGFVAADAVGLVRVDGNGTHTRLAETGGVPSQVRPDADGGVVFVDRDGGASRVQRVAAAGQPATTLATGPPGQLGLTTSTGGKVFITGRTDTLHQLPATVARLDASADSTVSTRGEAVVSRVEAAGPPDPRAPRPVHVRARSTRTGRELGFTVDPAATLTPRSAPVDADRVCAVPRNDPNYQVYQPKPKQVEWAADMAVKGHLSITRPANWKSNGLASYTPQGMFPPIALTNTSNGQVPAQVLLGILGQESNLWEAARFVLPGQTGNPLVGNYYGVDIYNNTEADDWDIHWDKADCGYGVSQLTDGMRLPGKPRPDKPNDQPLPRDQQVAIATDYAANVAAGLRLLQTKWNQLQDAHMTVNDNDPSKIENWFFAAWAYNSGYHQQGEPDAAGAYGLGWGNNPANPNYDPNRQPFGADPTDFAHPQRWPYPEKVMGFAANPPSGFEGPGQSVVFFRAANWNGTLPGPGGPGTAAQNKANVRPPINKFCDSAKNNCEWGTLHTPDYPGDGTGKGDVRGEPSGPCAHRNGQYFDLKCWWHDSVTWKTDCSYSCGNEFIRYDYPDFQDEPVDGTSYPPRCGVDGLPAGALVVDDVDDSVAPVSNPNCARPVNSGSFSFDFAKDSTGLEASKIDLHQIGGGYGAHFWFGHTRTAGDNGGKLRITGTWRLNQARNGPMKIMVALPDHGAQTNGATYLVRTATGDRTVVVRQPGDGNRWVPLGTFMFNNVPEVSVSTVTANGDGSQDLAFDAMAFVPVNGQYHEESVEADALFDENQNIDTAAPESWLAGPLANRQALYDWATGTAGKIVGLVDCQPEVVGDCLQPHSKQAISAWLSQVRDAGTDPTNHPQGNSIARWIGFGNSYQDRPTSALRPASFDDDAGYKIRLRATMSFVTGDNGKIISGSESAKYAHRTANTHLPRFMLDLFQAVQDDYGISRPDLRYRMPDLNHHDGEWTFVDPYTNGGFFPGRAYVSSGMAPALVDSSGAQSTDNAVCLAARVNAGGSIGYRPMLSQSGPVGAMKDWADQLGNDPRVAKPIAALAADIRSMFFNDGVPGVTGSLFKVAPPIWQELNFKACADGSIQRVADQPVLRSSWMPSQYLYHNNQAVNLDGTASGSSQPVLTGDFRNFSSTGALLTDTPYGNCSAGSGRTGNPWDLPVASASDTDPGTGHFCANADNLAPDPNYSG
ncbi:hypothetical protein, partial [Solihabitans fulvus]|uniref:golvesin C-terminal-like domain-containing protein n=1 Tax=Solihabitans fulvus TaxID=1892852 RepID=UPI001661C345